VRPYLENTQHKTGLVEFLPSRCNALSSSPSIGKKKKKVKEHMNKWIADKMRSSF
jgi:hypothetical protein